MPPKRAVEDSKSTEECTLQYGKNSNIIKWREHMQTIATELYGIVGIWSERGLGRRTEVSVVDGGLKTEAWDKRRR